MPERHRPGRPLLLYDVDPVNPYGRELAAVLTGRGYDVALLCSRALEWIPSGVEARQSLAAPAGGPAARIGVVWRRGVGVLAAVAWMLRRRGVIVVVWSRDAWDAAVLALLARVTGRVVVVDHNPVPGRRASGAKGASERLLRRWAHTRVVHGETLRAAARDDPRAQGRVEVVAHPSYVRWRERFVAPVTAAAPAVERVLVLGALRADKGRDDVPAVVAHLPAGTEVVVVGRTAPPPTWAAAADAAQVSLRVVGGSGPVPDEVLGRELAAGGVLLAPYTGATQSGTVVLALTCGIPVLAYAAGELPALLTAESLVSPPVPADLAAAYRRLRRHPWPTARVRPEELDEACAHDWGRVLAAFSR